MSDKPKHGRRAAGDGTEPAVSKGWGEENQVEADPTANLEKLDDGIDEADVKPREEVDMAGEVADAPVEYHSAMPQLSELDVASKWASLAQNADGYDLTCLTEVLCSQLDDEDVPWNPEVMLVQLTSELLDAVEARDDDGAAPQVSASSASITSPTEQTVGDLRTTRRRREKA